MVEMVTFWSAMRRDSGYFAPWPHQASEYIIGLNCDDQRAHELELELELIQYQMTQKPKLWCEGEGAPVRVANKPRSQEKKGGVCVVSHCL